jgi:hypothetical protein
LLLLLLLLPLLLSMLQALVTGRYGIIDSSSSPRMRAACNGLALLLLVVVCSLPRRP